MTFLVAVTGGIGAGKSTVASRWARNGALVISSDVLAREVVAPGSPGLAAVAAALGHAVVVGGALDRAKVAALVFADQGARSVLESITHPLVRAQFAEIAATARTGQVVVNDIPLLVHPAQIGEFQLTIGVRAELETRVRRLIARGLPESDARARIAAQVGDEVREPLCDVWLDNDRDPAQIDHAADTLWHQRILPFAENVVARTGAERPPPDVVPADRTWPQQARRLVLRIGLAAGGLRVDHIGSTAIPGLPARDIVDLQLTVPDLDRADRLSGALAAAGFPRMDGFDQDTPHPAGAAADPWAKRLHGSSDPGRRVDLHVRVVDAPNWRWALLLRDWLRADSGVRAEYLALELDRVRRFGASTAADAEAMEPWIEANYRRGLDWAAVTGWGSGPRAPGSGP